MSRLFYHVCQDNVGNLLFDVAGTVRIAGTGTLATIYGDEALTVIVPNPMTNHPSFGSFKCFLGAGDYDIYMTKTGYTFETLTGVQGHGTLAQQDAHAVTITGGSATGLAALSVTQPTARYNTEARGVFVPDYTPPSADPVALIGLISPGVNRYNLFLGGAAQNFMLGGLGIGTLPVVGIMLTVAGILNVTGTSTRYNTEVRGILVPDYTPPGADPVALLGQVSAGVNRYNLFIDGTADNFLQGHLGIGFTPRSDSCLYVQYPKAAIHGMTLKPSDNDTGPATAIVFLNVAAAGVGNITTTATATAFNTVSDARLKYDVAPLTGALDVVRALRPITHRWKADDSRGAGFLANEVAEIVDGVITGEKDAVDEEGRMLPQMIDLSKLTPWLVSACQDLAQQVQTLTAKVASLETQRGR